MANAIITVCLTLLVVSTLYLSTRELEKASKMDNFADQVVKDVSSLTSLSYAYLLLASERPRVQWQLKHDSLGRLLSLPKSTSPEAQALLEQLRRNHGQIKGLFDALNMRTGQDRKGSAAGSPSYDELNEGVTAQLMMRAELMVNDAFLLSRLADQEVERLGRTTYFLILAATFFLIVLTISTTAMLIKSIGGSMRKLNKGVQEIASGNLGYRIKVRNNDEISLVAASFNDMAAKLATSNKSLLQLNQTLEQRVGERTAQLEASEWRLRRFYESGMLGVLYWNMDGAIVDANDRFLDMAGYTREDLAKGKIDWIKMTPVEYRHLDERSSIELKATGVNKAPFEKEYVRRDGTRIPVLVAGAMLDEERFNGVAFVLDITKRKQAEEEVRTHVEELRRINEELARFNRVAVGRELRMIELKKEVNELSARLGEPQPYKVENGKTGE